MNDELNEEIQELKKELQERSNELDRLYSLDNLSNSQKIMKKTEEINKEKKRTRTKSNCIRKRKKRTRK